MKYQPIIGLEVHVELKTKSKMFCGCSASYFGKEPNTHTCPVCLGLPGALPVPNKKAIEWCVMIGLALNCKINEFSKFDRKNYFYPDLSKGYQISQYDMPFGENGYILLKNGKKIAIRRVHMEEDTGKLIHEGDSSLIDFNRSGVPLVEIVTEPDFTDALEVKEYLQRLQQIVRYLDVSNADMEKGEMRLEPNISLLELSLRGTEGDKAISKRSLHSVRDDKKFELPKYKVEVKNINSFKFVEKAINYELKRQEEILEKGETPIQETRGWNENKQKTFSQRSKEDAHDYRYFPEPDIPPVRTLNSQLSTLSSNMPELPDAKFERFQKEYSLPAYDAEILTREKHMAELFEKIAREAVNEEITPKQVANIIINKKIDIANSSPSDLINTIKQTVQVSQIDPTALNAAVEEVISENQKAVDDYKKGKTTVIMFLVGQVMKKLDGKANANLVKTQLEKTLK